MRVAVSMLIFGKADVCIFKTILPRFRYKNLSQLPMSKSLWLLVTPCKSNVLLSQLLVGYSFNYSGSALMFLVWKMKTCLIYFCTAVLQPGNYMCHLNNFNKNQPIEWTPLSTPLLISHWFPYFGQKGSLFTYHVSRHQNFLPYDLSAPFSSC